MKFGSREWHLKRTDDSIVRRNGDLKSSREFRAWALLGTFALTATPLVTSIVWWMKEGAWIEADLQTFGMLLTGKTPFGEQPFSIVDLVEIDHVAIESKVAEDAWFIERVLRRALWDSPLGVLTFFFAFYVLNLLTIVRERSIERILFNLGRRRSDLVAQATDRAQPST
ncbi:hypothetical protein [Parvularcula dongshanensis]|uniref:Uncharacterized protein n=1 Tax=Parvularcula dongshanensis TaxID=1173995 RepID=A0A840I071_9PROT|nr:hypothetical protein [Parvularcula dongshanensis]MBB4657510.1 hypothetical protein [Parvularcula dongshanensis]